MVGYLRKEQGDSMGRKRRMRPRKGLYLELVLWQDENHGRTATNCGVWITYQRNSVDSTAEQYCKCVSAEQPVTLGNGSLPWLK